MSLGAFLANTFVIETINHWSAALGTPLVASNTGRACFTVLPRSSCAALGARVVPVLRHRRHSSPPPLPAATCRTRAPPRQPGVLDASAVRKWPLRPPTALAPSQCGGGDGDPQLRSSTALICSVVTGRWPYHVAQIPTFTDYTFTVAAVSPAPTRAHLFASASCGSLRCWCAR